MIYRKLGKNGRDVSVLGFGCMRLPVKDGKADEIDKDEATRMLDEAVDRGVNYIDTAYPYHEGKSEVFVGEYISRAPRDKLIIATKMPCWLVQSYSDFDRFLDEQLERLQTGHIDYYLLHGLFVERWKQMKSMDAIGWSLKAREDGRIGALGFSFHDTFPLLKEVIDAYDDWALCQIQYNYMNEQTQAGTAGLLYAASRGVPVVVMEPLFGGALANPPEKIKAEFACAGKNPVELALRWLWDKPEVSLVLSGMSTMDQVKKNISIADKAGINTLTDEEKALIEKVKGAYAESNPIPCTRCGYCMPCPSGLDIPRNFELYNQAKGQNFDLGKALYTWHIDPALRADSCTECGNCEDMCPQHIPIMDWMKTTHKELLIEE